MAGVEPSFSLNLSLRPQVKENPEDSDISSLVWRLKNQYGSIRSVTEQGLRDSAAEEASAMDTDETDSELKVEPEEKKGTLEYIAAKKMEMIKEIELVHIPQCVLFVLFLI